MTVLQVIRDASTKLGFALPEVVFSETTRTAVELQEAINEAAQGVIDDFDWQALKTIATVTGNGSATDFALPANYARMLKKAQFWPSEEPTVPVEFITDSDRWLALETSGMTTVTRRATIYGNRLHVKPIVANLATVQFFYIKNEIVVAEGGTEPTKATFTADSDTFYLNERVLKLSFIWRWKAAKGRPYAEDRLAYEAVLDSKAGTDKGSHVLRIGKPRHPRDATPTYPWPVGQ